MGVTLKKIYQFKIESFLGNSSNLYIKIRELVCTSFDGLPKAAILIFFISTLFSVLVFNQGDLSHTAKSSFAYLNGNILDFYDANKLIVGTNDYFPLLYVFFAVWFIPLKIIGFASDEDPGYFLLPIEIIWAKIFLALLLFATVIVVNLITRELFPKDQERRKVVVSTYLLSPFALFAATVFGQYDVIGLLFSLVGFLYYLRGNTTRFVLFFSIAISLKFFALIVFVPLVLLKYKKIHQILSIIGCSSLAVIIQVLVYSGSPAFRESAFRLVSSKSQNTSNEFLTITVAVIFAAGCIFLWRIKPPKDIFGKQAVFVACVAYGLMFEVVVWHPQWLILISPFFAMAVGYFKRPSAFLIWESIAFLSFIWFVVNWWTENVDNTMIERGAFPHIFSNHQFLLSDLYQAANRGVDFKVAVYIFFISPLIYLLIEKILPRFNPIFKYPRAWVWISRALIIPVFWTVPTIIAVYFPLSWT